jgi:hypothetical protein
VLKLLVINSKIPSTGRIGTHGTRSSIGNLHLGPKERDVKQYWLLAFRPEDMFSKTSEVWSPKRGILKQASRPSAPSLLEKNTVRNTRYATSPREKRDNHRYETVDSFQSKMLYYEAKLKEANEDTSHPNAAQVNICFSCLEDMSRSLPNYGPVLNCVYRLLKTASLSRYYACSEDSGQNAWKIEPAILGLKRAEAREDYMSEKYKDLTQTLQRRGKEISNLEADKALHARAVSTFEIREKSLLQKLNHQQIKINHSKSQSVMFQSEIHHLKSVLSDTGDYIKKLEAKSLQQTEEIEMLRMKLSQQSFVESSQHQEPRNSSASLSTLKDGGATEIVQCIYSRAFSDTLRRIESISMSRPSEEG